MTDADLQKIVKASADLENARIAHEKAKEYLKSLVAPAAQVPAPDVAKLNQEWLRDQQNIPVRGLTSSNLAAR